MNACAGLQAVSGQLTEGRAYLAHACAGRQAVSDQRTAVPCSLHPCSRGADVRASREDAGAHDPGAVVDAACCVLLSGVTGREGESTYELARKMLALMIHCGAEYRPLCMYARGVRGGGKRLNGDGEGADAHDPGAAFDVACVSSASVSSACTFSARVPSA